MTILMTVSNYERSAETDIQSFKTFSIKLPFEVKEKKHLLISKQQQETHFLNYAIGNLTMFHCSILALPDHQSQLFQFFTVYGNREYLYVQI